MDVLCSRCNAQLRIDIPADYTGISIQYRCPKCDNVSIYHVNSHVIPFHEIPGWLVVHDERTRTQSYTLLPGKNMIGRGDSAIKQERFFRIQTKDSFMAQVHFSISACMTQQGNWTFLIADESATNSIVLNADRNKKVPQGIKHPIIDGDVIQAGRTKIVFKSSQSVENKEEAEEKVKSSAFLKTIIF